MNSAIAYEAHARQFLDARERSCMGADVIEHWATSLPAGTEVIEIACGGGFPVTSELVAAGLKLWAIDSSPTLLETFRRRFPQIPSQCSPALESDFFGRKFGAAIAIGLLFLLEESEQLALLQRVSEILLPDGLFLFTAPVQTATWQDIVTGNPCRSLGEARYVQALERAGFRVVGRYVDEGENHYYEGQKVNTPA